LRIDFLKNIINKDKWKQSVQKINKKYNKDIEIIQALRLFWIICKDIIIRCLDENSENVYTDKYFNIIEKIKEFDEIKNKCILDISKKYKVKYDMRTSTPWSVDNIIIFKLLNEIFPFN